MRDGNVYGLVHELSDRINNLTKQTLFLDMRMRAYEELMSHRKSIIHSIIDPVWLRLEVDKTQLRMMKDHNEQIKEIVKKRQEDSQKSKIQIIQANGLAKLLIILVCGLIFSGCASFDCQQRINYQNRIISNLRNEVNVKNDRLRKFNQLNEDDSLRGSSNDDSKGWDLQP